MDEITQISTFPSAMRHEALVLVEEAHRPVALWPDFLSQVEPEVQEDGTLLIQILEVGPNWTTRYTSYVVSHLPEVHITEASSPCGWNSGFIEQVYSYDESGLPFDFIDRFISEWTKTCPGWFESGKPEVRESFLIEYRT